jgi:hypothetical protein
VRGSPPFAGVYLEQPSNLRGPEEADQLPTTEWHAGPVSIVEYDHHRDLFVPVTFELIDGVLHGGPKPTEGYLGATSENPSLKLAEWPRVPEALNLDENAEGFGRQDEEVRIFPPRNKVPREAHLIHKRNTTLFK